MRVRVREREGETGGIKSARAIQVLNVASTEDTH